GPRGRRTVGGPSVRSLVAASLAAFIAARVGWLYVKDLQHVEMAAPKQEPEKTPVPPPESAKRSLEDRIGAAAPPPAAPAPSVTTAPDAAIAPPARPATPPPSYNAPAPSVSPPQPGAPAHQAAPAPRAAQRSEQPLAKDAPPKPLARQRAGEFGIQGHLGVCREDDPGDTIIGCTRIIEDRARGAGDRWQAFFERGMAYAQRNELDRAIGDFTEVIKLDPRNAAAFYNRNPPYPANA